MTSLVNSLTSFPTWAVYLVVTTLVFSEAAAFVGLVIPGETALLVGGALAGAGRLSLPLLMALAVAAAIVGDSVGYEVGRHLGPRLTSGRAGRFIGERRWTRAQAVMARYGGWAVLFGRWVGVLRALMPAIAGATQMPYRRFLPFNAIGGTVWAVAVVTAAYLAGASWHRVQSYLGSASGVLAAVVAAFVVIVVIRRWRGRRRHDAAEAGSGSR
jgi:membrane protein DedA with SNARE-associated domain